jgi:hypothetical protein
MPWSTTPEEEEISGAKSSSRDLSSMSAASGLLLDPALGSISIASGSLPSQQHSKENLLDISNLPLHSSLKKAVTLTYAAALCSNAMLSPQELLQLNAGEKRSSFRLKCDLYRNETMRAEDHLLTL